MKLTVLLQEGGDALLEAPVVGVLMIVVQLNRRQPLCLERRVRVYVCV